MKAKDQKAKETEGAWIVHHGQKTLTDSYGPAEFPAIDTASKASALLSQISATNEYQIPKSKVEALARSARLNPKTELPSLLQILSDKKLIEISGGSVQVLGLTSRAVLTHASSIFDDLEPSVEEQASIELAEIASAQPTDAKHATEVISDTFSMASRATEDFLRRAEEIGFVDTEGDGVDKLYFNGNLFKRDHIKKTTKVLDSLNPKDRVRMGELNDLLKIKGCVTESEADQILTAPLFEKLRAAGVYDVHYVTNPGGQFGYVTLPSAFHKFSNPLVDDAFDLAKALVAALSYGMHQSAAGRGRIFRVDALLRKLISGNSVGPATAIGEDYKILEQRGVIEVLPIGSLYMMSLKKRDIGEIALQVLLSGDANASVLDTLPSATMTGYLTPEQSRAGLRRKQTGPSRKMTHDVLDALRTRGGL